MKRTLILSLIALVALLALPSASKADTIITLSGTGASCGGSDCFGNVITLTIHPTGGTSYVVTMTINTSGNTNAGSAIAGVNFKFGSGITSASLISAPPGTWTTLVANGLNSNGCTTTNGSSFGCSIDSGFINASSLSAAPIVALSSGGTFTWQWNVTAGGTVTGNSVHIGALFGGMKSTGPKTHPNISFQSTGIISASTAAPPPPPQVPEPGTLALFGTGLLAVAGAVRRRFGQ